MLHPFFYHKDMATIVAIVVEPHRKTKPKNTQTRLLITDAGLDRIILSTAMKLGWRITQKWSNHWIGGLSTALRLHNKHMKHKK